VRQATALLETAEPLLGAARDLVGPGVVVAGGRMTDWTCSLWPEEEDAVARAVPLRRHEFEAGRAAARHAMSSLGLAPRPLPRRPDGPPLWPEGLTGSLTHGGGHVLAALGRLGPRFRALGLDLEPHVPLPPDLAAEVCRPDEDAARAIRVFGAKEAAYKAQFMLTGEMLDHVALRIAFGPGGRFVAEFTRRVAGFSAGDRLSGGQALVGSLLLSAVRIGDDGVGPS
jgi:4'-phosphopantetheinyl transferase EntD